MLRGLLSHAPSVTPRALPRTLPLANRSNNAQPQRFFSLSASVAAEKPLPPRLKINDADLTISYLKGSGPGGQKINKTNSAVQICHHPTGLVVKSQATRSQSQNEKIARRLLADRIEERQKGGESRTAIKADRARKKKASSVKKSKRKYRELDQKLDDEDEGQHGEEEEKELSGDEKFDSGVDGSTDQQPLGR